MRVALRWGSLRNLVSVFSLLPLRLDGLLAGSISEDVAPNLLDCTIEGAPSLRQTKFPRKGSGIAVEWVTPNCAVGGNRVRVDALLKDDTVSGEMGLADASGMDGNAVVCIDGAVQTIQDIEDDELWIVTWYVLHAGQYALCYRADPTKDWTEQLRITIIYPTPWSCSAQSSIMCEYAPDVSSVKVFDGFFNNLTERPYRCAASCNDCLSDGATCVCYGAARGGTCGVCAQECDSDMLANGTCVCADAQSFWSVKGADKAEDQDLFGSLLTLPEFDTPLTRLQLQVLSERRGVNETLAEVEAALLSAGDVLKQN